MKWCVLISRVDPPLRLFKNCFQIMEGSYNTDINYYIFNFIDSSFLMPVHLFLSPSLFLLLALQNFAWCQILRDALHAYLYSGFIITLENVCPYALLIVIAKANWTGNCHLLKVNGYSLSEYNVIRFKNIIFPILSPIKIMHFNKLLVKSTTLNVSHYINPHVY